MINSFFDKINAPVRQVTYDRPDGRQPLTGELLEKHGREISVLVSDSRVVKAMLREPIQQEVGERVAIDRRQIEHMETAGQKAAGEETGQSGKTLGSHPADQMLERLQVPVSEEARMAFQSLEKHGLELTRGNVMALMTSKGLLDQVIGSMTHEKALQLLERNIDPNRTSLQDLARLLQETPEAKETFSFLKFLGLKKEMTTTDAEKTAQKLYGQKMGKDVADAVKALDKQGMEATRQQVDRLLGVQEKLFTLKGIREETLLETVKGKIDPSLENLYKLHRGVEKGPIQAEPSLISKSSSYGQAAAPGHQVTAAELKAMEEDIARQIRGEGLEATPERLRLAGVFLNNGVAVTGETLQRMESLKEAVQLVTEKLDGHLLSALQKAGIQVEKQDVTQLAQWIRDHETAQASQPETLPETSAAASAHTPVSREALETTLKQLEQQLANLEKMDEKQLIQLIRQGGELRLEQLAPAAERITLTGLSENDQQALKLAVTLGRLSEMNLDTAAFHLRRQAPVTLQQLVETQRIMAAEPEKAMPPETQPSQGENRVNQAVEAYLAQRGVHPQDMQRHEDIEALRALERQQLPLNENRVSQLYAIRGAVENLQQMTLNEARQAAAASPAVPPESQPLHMLHGMMESVSQHPESAALITQILQDLAMASSAGMDPAFQKLELMETLRMVSPEMLAFQEKHQLPMTPEALKLTIQLFHEQISLEDFREAVTALMAKDENAAGQRVDQMPLIHMPQEMDGRMEPLLNKHLADLFPHVTVDSDNGEQLKQLARILMQQQMPVNRESLQQLMQITRQMEEIVTRLPQQDLMSLEGKPAKSPESGTSPLMQQTLQQLAEWLKTEQSEGKTEAGGRNGAQTGMGSVDSRSLAKLAETMTSLQSLAGEESRKDSLLSLLVKNAVPLSLQEVRQMDLFLQNRNQVGQLIGQLMGLLEEQSEKADHPARQAAEQLSRLMQQAGEQMKNGKGPDPELYRETARILRNLEPAMEQMNPAAREALSQTGERLLNSLELQSQLNKEDTVYQLPFMLNGQMQNMQLYFLNQRKNKKIDPRDMTVLLNFDTQHMGNLTVFVGVKYKKVVMKIGVQKLEDKEWIDTHRNQLEEVMAAMDYEIKDLAYRVEEEHHLMSLADDIQEFRGVRHGQLDLRI